MLIILELHTNKSIMEIIHIQLFNNSRKKVIIVQMVLYINCYQVINQMKKGNCEGNEKIYKSGNEKRVNLVISVGFLVSNSAPSKGSSQISANSLSGDYQRKSFKRTRIKNHNHQMK